MFYIFVALSFLTTPGDFTIRGSATTMPAAGSHYYGGMGIFENDEAQTIDSTTWHMVFESLADEPWETGLVNGMVFQNGNSNAVSGAYADAGGSPNEVVVTAAGHPFAAGQVVSLGIKNVSGANDVTYRYVHVSVFQL